MLNFVRNALGKIIILVDRLTAPRPVVRDAAGQAKVDAACKDLVLYDLANCPFCVKVRRTMTRLVLPIARRDVGVNATYHQELMAGGKEDQLPCLRITENNAVRWLYESDAINAYLAQRFG